MLLDGERVVGPTFDRRVVGDDEDVLTGNASNARDDACGRGVALIESPGRERREFEKWCVGIEEFLDPLAHRQFALLAMPLQILWSATLTHGREPLAVLGD